MNAMLNESWRAAARNPSGANSVNPAPAYTVARRMLRRLSEVGNRSIVFMEPPVGSRGSRQFADYGRVSTPLVRSNMTSRVTSVPPHAVAADLDIRRESERRRLQRFAR